MANIRLSTYKQIFASIWTSLTTANKLFSANRNTNHFISAPNNSPFSFCWARSDKATLIFSLQGLKAPLAQTNSLWLCKGALLLTLICAPQFRYCHGNLVHTDLLLIHICCCYMLRETLLQKRPDVCDTTDYKARILWNF